MDILKTVPSSLKYQKLKQFLKIFNIIVASVLILWVGLGNFIAFQAEQPILAAKAELIQRFPNREANVTTRQVDELVVSLKLGSSDQGLEIRELTSKYFDRFIKESSDRIETPPEALQEYLKTHSALLKAIRQLLLANESPTWQAADLSRILAGDFTYPLPSSLYTINLQRLLLSDALNHLRLGENKDALEGLAASKKLTQSFGDRPDLIGQLVALIASRQQMFVLRKLGQVPSEWQHRLANTSDFPKTMRLALQIETLMQYEVIRNFPSYKFLKTEARSFSFSDLIQPFRQPYLTIIALNYWQETIQSYDKLSKEICGFNAEILDPPPPPSIWNPSELFPKFGSQWLKVGRNLIDWELTQKILQIKEIATQTGKYPQSLLGIETSSVCKDLHYTYRVSASGDEMTIAIKNKPNWWKEDDYQLPSKHTSKIPRETAKG